jgi:Holliday junction resolvase RusA-like endonuclease
MNSMSLRVAEPPEGGRLTFVIERPPVSQQSRRSEKDAFADAVRARMGDCAYLLSGDVKVGIEWTLHEQERYESDAPPDVDNILKPLLDTLCGPQGVLIDDCQVQAVDCRWIDWTLREQRVEITIDFLADEWIPKDALYFLHLGSSIYFPINLIGPAAANHILIDSACRMWRTREELLKLGNDYYVAKSVMSIQRVFHRSRITRFQVIELDALRMIVNQLAAGEPPEGNAANPEIHRNPA